MATAVKAGAAVKQGVAGYDTLGRAQGKAVHELRSLRNKATCCIGMYVCNKPQEIGFGKVTAEDLYDIRAYIFGLLKDTFGTQFCPR